MFIATHLKDGEPINAAAGEVMVRKLNPLVNILSFVNIQIVNTSKFNRRSCQS